jgi:hypothetical protein
MLIIIPTISPCVFIYIYIYIMCNKNILIIIGKVYKNAIQNLG